MDDPLESEVDYEIEGDMPLVSFFETLRNGTKKGFELRKAKKKREKKNENAAATDKKLIEDCKDI